MGPVQFILVERDTGQVGYLRPDSIVAICDDEVPKRNGPVVRVLSVHLTNNVVWRLVGETHASLISKIRQGCGINVNIIRTAAPEDMPPVEAQPAAA